MIKGITYILTVVFFSTYSWANQDIKTSSVPINESDSLAYLMKYADSLEILAEKYVKQNMNDSALLFYQEAIKLLLNEKVQKDTMWAVQLSKNYNDLAELHSNINNLEQALLYNSKAIELNRQFSLVERSVNSCLTRGKIAYMQGNDSLASVYWKEGLAFCDLSQNDDLRGRLFNNLGSVAFGENKLDEALSYYMAGYEIQIKLNNIPEIVKTANNIGLVYFNQNNYNLSIEYLLKADELGEANELLNSQAITSYYLVFNYLRLMDYEKTQEAFDKYEQTSEKVYNIKRSEQINELEIKYKVEQKNNEIALLEKEKQIAKLELQERNKLILFIVMGVIIILLFIRFRFVYFKKQQTINRQKLEFQKIVTEQQLLRTQMNPHFIFNSLNSIQSFITLEKPYEAEKFLARFSKLMRGILENSRLEFVPLEKEIEILQLYLELEQLRFENRFSFNIDIDEEMETEFIHIPPMLIQPFVENAILHGIRNIQNGRINISLKENEYGVICIIDDNGRGRKKSAELSSPKKHTSIATAIVQERLKTLSVQLNKEAFFIFEDKTDGNNCPSGTKVTLQIPFKEV